MESASARQDNSPVSGGGLASRVTGASRSASKAAVDTEESEIQSALMQWILEHHSVPGGQSRSPSQAQLASALLKVSHRPCCSNRIPAPEPSVVQASSEHGYTPHVQTARRSLSCSCWCTVPCLRGAKKLSASATASSRYKHQADASEQRLRDVLQRQRALVRRVAELEERAQKQKANAERQRKEELQEAVKEVERKVAELQQAHAKDIVNYERRLAQVVATESTHEAYMQLKDVVEKAQEERNTALQELSRERAAFRKMKEAAEVEYADKVRLLKGKLDTERQAMQEQDRSFMTRIEGQIKQISDAYEAQLRKMQSELVRKEEELQRRRSTGDDSGHTTEDVKLLQQQLQHQHAHLSTVLSRVTACAEEESKKEKQLKAQVAEGERKIQSLAHELRAAADARDQYKSELAQHETMSRAYLDAVAQLGPAHEAREKAENTAKAVRVEMEEWRLRADEYAQALRLVQEKVHKVCSTSMASLPSDARPAGVSWPANEELVIEQATEMAPMIEEMSAELHAAGLCIEALSSAERRSRQAAMIAGTEKEELKGELQRSKSLIDKLRQQEGSRQHIVARSQQHLDELTKQMKTQAQVITDAYQHQILTLQEELRQATASRYATSMRTAELEAELAQLTSDPGDGSTHGAMNKELYDLQRKLALSERALEKAQERLGATLELNAQLTNKFEELGGERGLLNESLPHTGKEDRGMGSTLQLSPHQEQMESLRRERDDLRTCLDKVERKYKKRSQRYRALQEYVLELQRVGLDTLPLPHGELDKSVALPPALARKGAPVQP
eukprot:scaffold1041_cov414-Prasinococcus_capsulatus_cf.AAC.7